MYSYQFCNILYTKHRLSFSKKKKSYIGVLSQIRSIHKYLIDFLLLISATSNLRDKKFERGKINSVKFTS